MKTFSVTTNVGSAKYVVSFNDGVKTHKDGSLFFDIVIFSSKKKLAAFTKELCKNGYMEV